MSCLMTRATGRRHHEGASVEGPRHRPLAFRRARPRPACHGGPGNVGQRARPGLVEQIGDAMDVIGKSVETVALIHLKIAYDDTAAIVPTEAARMLVAQSIRECVRYDDNVSRGGENSFVLVARLRPGSPTPRALEKG